MELTSLKTVLECLAILVAGCWAIFGFFVFRKRAKVIAELRKIEVETRKLERESRYAAVINVAIEATLLTTMGNGPFEVHAMVTLHNTGNRDTRIQWEHEPSPFSVRRVAFTNAGAPTFEKPFELRVTRTLEPDSQALSHVIRAGATERLAFAFRVHAKGTYLLCFRGAVDHKEKQAAKDLGVTRPTSWTAKRYIAV